MADRIATRKRSVVKALTYRVFIICLDFTAVYLLTGETKAALGFGDTGDVWSTRIASGWPPFRVPLFITMTRGWSACTSCGEFEMAWP